MIPTRLLLLLVVVAALSPGCLGRKKGGKRVPPVEAEQVKCTGGKEHYYVNLKRGQYYMFETADFYPDKSRCKVDYKVGDCSQVVITTMELNLKTEQTCYSRIVGNGRSANQKAQKVLVCDEIEYEQKFHQNGTLDGEDPGTGMTPVFNPSSRRFEWPDDVGLNEDFSMIIRAGKGIKNKGASISLKVECAKGHQHDNNYGYADCQCGLKNESSMAPPPWQVDGEVVVAKEWKVVVLPEESPEYEELNRTSNFKIGKYLFAVYNSMAPSFNKDGPTPVCLPSPGSLERKLGRKARKQISVSSPQFDKETNAFTESIDFNVQVLSTEVCAKKLKNAQLPDLEEDEGCVVPIKKNSPSVCQGSFGTAMYTKVHEDKDKKNVALFGFITELPDWAQCATKRVPARFQRIGKSFFEKIEKEKEHHKSFTTCPAEPMLPNCFPTESSGLSPAFCGRRQVCCTGQCVTLDRTTRESCCGDKVVKCDNPTNTSTASWDCIDADAGTCGCPEERVCPGKESNGCCLRGSYCCAGSCHEEEYGEICCGNAVKTCKLPLECIDDSAGTCGCPAAQVCSGATDDCCPSHLRCENAQCVR